MIGYFPVNSKTLLLYGYFLPILGAVIVSTLPLFFGEDGYLGIAEAFQANVALAISVLGVAAALAIPFQTKILAEDNQVILQVLEGTNVREVFSKSSHYQAGLIILLGLFLLIASTVLDAAPWVGAAMLFSSALVGFEALSMVSNGRAYSQLREKILTETAKANKSRHPTTTRRRV